MVARHCLNIAITLPRHNDIKSANRSDAGHRLGKRAHSFQSGRHSVGLANARVQLTIWSVRHTFDKSHLFADFDKSVANTDPVAVHAVGVDVFDLHFR